MRIPGGGEVSPYDRLVWPEGAIEALLASGERRREVVAYLGEAEYLALQPLARAAAQAPRDPQRCVVLVPGIMGSQLGLPRPAPLPDNLLWIDPVDFQQGHLELLALPGPPIRSLGPVLYSYLPLKLALEAAGWTVRYFDYDWRLDLNDQGRALAARLAAETASNLQIIGHSMGGLLGRIALATPAGARVRRLITLGTPHGGAYAPVQALRGVYPLIRRVAQLDPQHSAEELASRVFSTFPSLYQMLPQHSNPDLGNAASWPCSGPRPRADMLATSQLPDATALAGRITCIAGHGFDTVVHASLEGGDLRYRVDRNGDGTVPLARATLPGAVTAYAPVGHSELPRHPQVHAALLDLLDGRRCGLASTAPPAYPNAHTYTDADLRALFTEKIDWAALEPAQRRHFLDSLNEAKLPLPHS
ncbi:MAG: hypothetical protein QM696_09640 [Steroidobacteraceae bacterium]